jgi:hypothetical protein
MCNSEVAILTMRRLSNAKRETLRKQLMEYHTQRAKKIAREIDLQQEREKKSGRISWIFDLLDIIADLFG